ncbi:MAG TPA: DUF692 domain-containing protein [Rhodospirillales bacterium]|jgi:uncharacterized protein (UPF0276 family)|nr:DUF692 domain-containing protein [Rhodospirillales bacterium]
MATPSPIVPTIRSGIGWRAPHRAAILDTRPAVGFLEVHAENHMSGRGRGELEPLRAQWPISVHGIGLSLGSAGGIDARHLDRLARLVAEIEPLFVSEHLSWSVDGDVYLNDLLPLPMTEEALAVVAPNVARAQDRLARPLLIENPSAYLRFAHSPIPEAEFLAELVRRTGCGLLVDVNNIFVTTHNTGGDAVAWMRALPPGAVAEIHLAGHAIADADGRPLLIDDHGSRVAPAVWALFATAVRLFPGAAPLIEWDTDLPELAVLLEEAAAADKRRDAALHHQDEGRDRAA